MTSPNQTPKRKNNATSNRRRNLIAQTMLLVVGIFCLIWLRNLQAKNGLPTARLAYNVGRDAYIAINLQTGERTELKLYGDPLQKSSPDKKWTAFWNKLTCCDSSLGVYSTDRGKNHKSLGINYGSSHSLSWMPDSESIVFSATPQEKGYYTSPYIRLSGIPEEIYLQNIYTHKKQRLTDNDFMDRYPAVSPDGKLIAYSSNADGVERLYLMDLFTHRTRLLTPDQDAYKPAWSPDGRWIAFISNCEEGLSDDNTCGDLWVIRVDGTQAQSIVLNSGHGEPLWLP